MEDSTSENLRFDDAYIRGHQHDRPIDLWWLVPSLIVETLQEQEMTTGPIPPITEQNIVDLAFNRWPHAAEVHVQFHTHLVVGAIGTTREGVYSCCIEGAQVRKQFTAETAIDLFVKVRQNRADEGFELDLDGSMNLLAASDLLWESSIPDSTDKA